MKRTMALLVAALAALAMVAGPAVANNSPVDEDGHTHHVQTGNGGCQDIDAVKFSGGERGLHRGANSSGRDAGPWHGPCEAETR